MNVIKLNEVATLHVQTENAKPYIIRINISGMPMQPRILYPSFTEIVRYLGEYGFVFPEDWCPEGNEEAGILPKSVIEEIKDLW